MAYSVFISYRRIDAERYALPLYRVLTRELGDGAVFLDQEEIPLGDDFRDCIDSALQASQILLALIGPNWRGDGERSSLEDPRDFVHLEIARALDRGARIVPVLVGDAGMPAPDSLPMALSPLSYRQAVRISGDAFDPQGRGFQRLLTAIRSEAASLESLPAETAEITSRDAGEDTRNLLQVLRNHLSRRPTKRDHMAGLVKVGRDALRAEEERVHSLMRVLVGDHLIRQAPGQRYELSPKGQRFLMTWRERP